MELIRDNLLTQISIDEGNGSTWRTSHLNNPTVDIDTMQLHASVLKVLDPRTIHRLIYLFMVLLAKQLEELN